MGTAAQEFPCRRDGCSQTVRFVPSPVTGALKRGSRATAVVYLRCADGHVHRYEVTTAEPADG